MRKTILIIAAGVALTGVGLTSALPASKPVAVLTIAHSGHTAKIATVQTKAVNVPIATAAQPTTPLVNPSIPKTTVTSTPQYTSTATTPVVASTDTSKCSASCTDPNRPSYDGWGNEWDYLGNLIHAACPNANDPISGQPNPECVCPTATTDGTYFIQGYDKDTNKVVCGFTYYNACPYADAVAATDPLCAKLTAVP